MYYCEFIPYYSVLYTIIRDTWATLDVLLCNIADNKPRSINQYSNMAPRSWVQIVNFFSFFSLKTHKRDLDIKKASPNIEYCPGSLRAMLEYWYIEHGLFLPVVCILTRPAGSTRKDTQRYYTAKRLIRYMHCDLTSSQACDHSAKQPKIWIPKLNLDSSLTYICIGFFYILCRALNLRNKTLTYETSKKIVSCPKCYRTPVVYVCVRENFFCLTWNFK